MVTLTSFQYIHEYNALADRGLAKPLRCHCGARFIPRIEDDTLVLWCPPDDYTMEPGLKLTHLIESTVDRYKT